MEKIAPQTREEQFANATPGSAVAQDMLQDKWDNPGAEGRMGSDLKIYRNQPQAETPPTQVEQVQPTAMPVQQMEVPAEQVDAISPKPQVEQNPQVALDMSTKPADVGADLKLEDQNFNKDLMMGHITPETYSSLFAKKDTLGKVGTLFGLIIGGAGSGLLKQENVVLKMMQKEIDNDLQAQIHSATNAQNFYRYNSEHQLRVAQAQKLGTEEDLIRAQTAKVPAEAKYLEAQTKLQNTEANTKAYALSRMQMNRAALHTMIEQTQKLPQGSPQRMQAEQALAMLSAGVQSENYDLADRAAAASALARIALNSSQSNPEQTFQQQQTALRVGGNKDMADFREQRHMPGIEGQSSIALTDKDRTEINHMQTLKGALQRFEVFVKDHSGSLSPSDRKTGQALAAQLQGAYRQATNGGVYKEGENKFIGSIIDQDPARFFNAIFVAPKIKAINSEFDHQMDQFLKSKGFEGMKAVKKEAAQPTQGLKEGQTGTYQGKPVVVENGKWKFK